jgi:hypothetical protein
MDGRAVVALPGLVPHGGLTGDGGARLAPLLSGQVHKPHRRQRRVARNLGNRERVPSGWPNEPSQRLARTERKGNASRALGVSLSY